MTFRRDDIDWLRAKCLKACEGQTLIDLQRLTPSDDMLGIQPRGDGRREPVKKTDIFILFYAHGGRPPPQARFAGNINSKPPQSFLSEGGISGECGLC